MAICLQIGFQEHFDQVLRHVMGLANNDRLKSESAEAMTQAEAEFNATGTPARVFKSHDEQQLDLFANQAVVECS